MSDERTGRIPQFSLGTTRFSTGRRTGPNPTVADTRDLLVNDKRSEQPSLLQLPHPESSQHVPDVRRSITAHNLTHHVSARRSTLLAPTSEGIRRLGTGHAAGFMSSDDPQTLASMNRVLSDDVDEE